MINRWLTYLLLFLCSIVWFPAQGQTLEGEFLLRPSLTSLRGNDLVKENLDPAFNLSVGAGVNFIIRENRLISVALLYETKGGGKEHTVELRDSNNQPIGNENGKLESNFQYILIPAQYAFRFGGKIQFEAGAGVYAGLLLKQETKSEVGQFKLESDDTEDFKTFDFGVSFSFSVYIPLKDATRLKVGVNDNLGLFNVSDIPVMDNGSIKHNSLALVMGLTLKLK